MFSAYALRVIMFGPTASPVVHAQSTWHIGPTTCVFTSRSRARRESDGSSDDSSHDAHRRQLGLDPARERDRVRRARAHEARRARDPVGEHVRPHRPGRRRAARHREREPALGVGERDVHGLLAAARSRRRRRRRRARTRRARPRSGTPRRGSPRRRSPPRPRPRTARGRSRSRARRRRRSPAARGSTPRRSSSASACSRFDTFAEWRRRRWTAGRSPTRCARASPRRYARSATSG